MTSITPSDRPCKIGWYNTHNNQLEFLKKSNGSLLIAGDPIANGLSRYPNIWNKYFKKHNAINCGIGGDRTQNVLWRAKEMVLPLSIRYVVLQFGTNNLGCDSPSKISQGILSVADILQRKSPSVRIIITGLLPRDSKWSKRRKSIMLVNKILRYNS